MIRLLKKKYLKGRRRSPSSSGEDNTSRRTSLSLALEEVAALVLFALNLLVSIPAA